MAGRRLAPLVLSQEERSELEGLVSRRKTAQALALRARIVLACAEGSQNKEVAVRLHVDEGTVGKWRRRFVEHRMEGLYDEPRCGAPRTIDDVRIEAVIVKTSESLPAPATHWSSRGMAKASGISVSSVQRIWRGFCLQPHRMETFKLSTDPDFVAAMLSASMSRRRNMQSFCVWTRSRRSRRSIAANPCCRCGPVSQRSAATITSVTARPRCSPLSTSRQGGSSASAMADIVPRSSANSLMRSRPRCRIISMCIWSWITTPRTRPR